MKVTARDIAGLVRDTQMELMRKRSAEPKESIIDALINDEVAKLTSLVGEGEEDAGASRSLAEGSQSLDPGEFINTQGWVSEFGSDVPSGAIPRPDAAKAVASAARPKEMPQGSPPQARIVSQDGAVAGRRAPQQPRTPPRQTNRPPPQPRTERIDDDVSLSQMLEPDKTGMHAGAGGGRGLLIIVLLLLVAGAGVVAALFLTGKL